MKNILFLTLLVTVFACAPTEEKVEDVAEAVAEVVTPTDPFIHHVYFYLNNPDSAEDRTELIEGLNKLAQVSTIQRHFIGVPASTDRDVIVKDYAVSWMCFFNNIEEEEMYQVDPIHLKFIEDYSHLWSGVKVYDSVPE